MSAKSEEALAEAVNSLAASFALLAGELAELKTGLLAQTARAEEIRAKAKANLAERLAKQKTELTSGFETDG